MKLTIKPSTYEDALYIASHTWERGRVEAQRCGFSDPDKWARHLLEMGKDYNNVLHADAPVCMFGAEEMPDGFYTFFAATDAFLIHSREITRTLRTFLRERIAEINGVPLYLASLCDHPKAHGWFEVLGFKRIKQDGVFSQYVYQGA